MQPDPMSAIAPPLIEGCGRADEIEGPEAHENEENDANENEGPETHENEEPEAHEKHRRQRK